MIDQDIFTDLKSKIKSSLKVYFWIAVALAIFIYMIPAPEFEMNVSGDYTGEELIESLPEKYAYLSEYINPEREYTVEETGYIILSICMLVFVLLGSCFVDQMCRRLRKYDSPPPTLPDNKKLTYMLVKYGSLTWIASFSALSIIWCNLSPEYLLAGTGFWKSIFSTLPFWILALALLTLFIVDDLLAEVIDERKNKSGGVK